MPTPTPSDLHIDVALTNVSVKFNNAKLIAEKIFPVIPVKKDSDKYFTYGKQDLRTYQTKRAPGTRAKQIEWTVDSTGSYLTEERSIEAQLIDEVRDNADDPIKYDADTTEITANILKLDLEKKIADLVTTSGNYAGGNVSTPSSLWDDFVNSDPIKDIDDAKEVVRGKVIMEPNTMIVPAKVHKYLRRHPKLLEMFKYTKSGRLTEADLKEVFEVDNYLVGKAIRITSAEGLTEVLADVWGKHCVLLYVTPTAGLKQLSFGYIFRKSGYPMVERWREDALRSDWIRNSDKDDRKIISSSAGYLLENVIP